ncbi:Methyltransferase family protein [Frankia canadensis]|uniref:Methyltransferase family protein n=1 Tax=Frankia canadensis TaxID=1836972 RepID=A0A2I2KYQ6_9ACTN|nr:class I SAM-dependent methyltransferase [Frankia canadensis]SNQ50795.1 Methyltransferase family protein [Frankia canadensis]SOU58085.1 Methyltransferase family protein [Frankia canadensis]
MPAFSQYDRRGYPSVDVRTGYGEWSDTYEQTVEDVMDLGLLAQLAVPAWDQARRAVDLGCGTGRTGSWLRARGVAALDGVDLTPRMLALARRRGVHDQLLEADATATGLPAAGYDLAVSCLMDEHLPELTPLYAEAARLTRPDGLFVLVGFHPHFIMTSGMPTHYDDRTGAPRAITTHVHLVSDQVAAGLATGWSLAEMRENVIDDTWLAVKPSWGRYLGHPFTIALVWRRAGRQGQPGESGESGPVSAPAAARP